MYKKFALLVVLAVFAALVLVACGDSTATSPAATTAASTTSAATTAAATTAASTTAAATTAATTAAMTTAATTSSATTAATTSSATTAAATTGTGSTSGSAYALQPFTYKAPASATKGGNITSISLAELSDNLHPYVSANNNSDSYAQVAALIWDGSLVTYDYNTVKWAFDAAKDLKVSSDNKVFTFTLRDDLKWSDGKPITVEDYKFAYDNAIKENKDNPDLNFVGLDDFKRLKSVDIDATAKTVKITLDDVYAPDLALSYLAALIPVPRQVWEGKDWFDASKNPEINKPTVVSGPYMVQSWDPKSQGVVVPNPNYYGPKPANVGQTFKGGSAAVVLQAVKTGQADWAVNIPPAQYQQAKGDATLNVIDWNAINGSYRYIEYNTKRAFSDKALRVAINYAIDRTSLIKLAENGLGKPQDTFLTPDSPFYNPNVKKYDYSLDNAKKALTDAGYKLDNGVLTGKDGKPVKITVIFPTSSNPRKLIATYLQQQLKQIGIDVTIDGKEFQAYLKQLKAKDFDISLSTAGAGFPDPDAFKSNIITDGQQNNTSYSNPTIDKLFDQGNRETDPAKRKDIYNQIQQTLSDDSPFYVLYNLTNYSVVTKQVQNASATKSSYLWDSYNTLGWTKSAQ